MSLLEQRFQTQEIDQSSRVADLADAIYLAPFENPVNIPKGITPLVPHNYGLRFSHLLLPGAIKKGAEAAVNPFYPSAHPSLGRVAADVEMHLSGGERDQLGIRVYNWRATDVTRPLSVASGDRCYREVDLAINEFLAQTLSTEAGYTVWYELTGRADGVIEEITPSKGEAPFVYNLLAAMANYPVTSRARIA